MISSYLDGINSNYSTYYTNKDFKLVMVRFICLDSVLTGSLLLFKVANQVSLQGIKWLGALGYMKSMPVEKFFRDMIAGCNGCIIIWNYTHLIFRV